MFTCMSFQAVHIEINHSLDTDSVILAWRCLIARRGNVQIIFLDSSFIGSESELRRALEEMDKEKLQLSCKHQMVIGLLGKVTLLMLAIYVVFGNIRSFKPFISLFL